jgi:hypothetical protein
MRKVVTAAFLGCLGAVAIAGADLEERISKLEAAADLDALTSRLTLGGYGEFHATRKKGATYGDYHRVVMYAGYQFNDWIRLNSEIELEHAKTTDGYILLEQFSVDLQVTDITAIRLGRTLAPLGIVGLRHEPPLFFGVERPPFEKYILPSTWSIDGVGLVGDLSADLSYEVYAVGGLDGSSFSEGSGIRGGREAVYPGLESPSLTGRLDYFGIDDLRVGGGFYTGSTDYGAEGVDAMSGGEVNILSLDAEYTAGALTLNGVWAAGDHKGNGVAVAASDFGGYYATAGYEIWREGEKAVVPFVRTGSYDTHEASTKAGTNDTEVDSTQYGLHVLLSDQFVLKADLLDENGTETFSVGFGMMFQ